MNHLRVSFILDFELIHKLVLNRCVIHYKLIFQFLWFCLDHRENILKTAKALVEDTKTLVAGAASSQEQLAVAAQNAVTTIVQLSEVVKSGAASLGSPNREAQVMLINAVKDVASALSDLMQSTKAASGKSIQDPAMHHLKDSAKVSFIWALNT